MAEGLTGFVRNLRDGRVEALAQGETEKLDRFERALYLGPAGARVMEVGVEDLAPKESGSCFDIDITYG